MDRTSLPISRRRFLALSAAVGAGVVGSGAVLAACGGPGGNSTDGSAAAHDTDLKDLALVQRFSNSGLAPGSLRLPVSLADQKGILDDAATARYESLTAHVVDVMTGKTVLEGIGATRHGEGLALPYWPFTLTLDTPGTYTLVVDGGSSDGAAFQVLPRKNVRMPVVSEPLPPFDSPTVDDARGVDPICTLPAGTCPFHTQTLTQALGKGTPVAYLIGTPAHCQTGTCGPALQALVEVAKKAGAKSQFVHAEVYMDRAATKIAPAVEAYKLDFEPILFVTDSEGVLRHRLDGVFDADEIREVLADVGVS